MRVVWAGRVIARLQENPSKSGPPASTQQIPIQQQGGSALPPFDVALLVLSDAVQHGVSCRPQGEIDSVSASVKDLVQGIGIEYPDCPDFELLDAGADQSNADCVGQRTEPTRELTLQERDFDLLPTLLQAPFQSRSVPHTSGRARCHSFPGRRLPAEVVAAVSPAAASASR